MFLLIPNQIKIKKIEIDICFTSILINLESFLLCVTFFAKDRLAFSWLKWNLTFLAAFGTSSIMHFSWSKISSESAISTGAAFSASSISVKISHGFFLLTNIKNNTLYVFFIQEK